MQSGQLPRKLGLIVGVNHYRDSTFRPLLCAENDAKALAQWFVNTKGGKWNPSDVQLVQGQHATKELIESLLVQLCLQVATMGDEVVFYFAGHAFVDERSGDGYLALANTRYQDTGTAINVRTLIQSTQSQSRAGHVLYIFDCFQTGRFWDMRRASQYDSKPLLGTAALAAIQQSTNRLCLCSCRGNALAGETGEGALGAFVHRLLLGLCGPAAESATGNVTLRKLHTYLFKNLPEQHRPQLFGQQASPFILVSNPVPAMVSAMQPPSSPMHSGSHVDQSFVKTSVAATDAQNGFSPPSQNGAPADQAFVETSERSKKGLLKMYAAATSSESTSVSFNQTASALTDSGQTPTTSGYLQKALQGEQEQSKQLLEQAQQCMQNQSYKEAFDLVEQVLRIVPQDIAALTLKGQLLGTAGRLAEAAATVERVLQIDSSNALAWSMRAVLLSNMGQQEAALSAIERSLEIDANNPESYSIKTRIMENIAIQQNHLDERAAMPAPNGAKKPVPPGASPMTTKDSPKGAWIGTVLQILGFILGIVGAASTYFLSQTIPYISLAIACLGLAIVCVLAARGAFHYGFSRFVPTVLLTVLATAILGGGYAVQGRIIANIRAQGQIVPQAAVSRLFAFSFIGIWLVAAALLPLVCGIFALIAGFVARKVKSGR